VASPTPNLQLDKEMKTKLHIRDEVFEILERRGFKVGWFGGPYYNVKLGQHWWSLPFDEACNWMRK